MNKQTVFITGTSSGFGFLTAKALTRKGHTVFASMRDSRGKNASAAFELIRHAENIPGRMHVLDLDVTDERSVQAAVDEALSLEGAIDVAVNNAGVGAIGLTECFTIDQFRQILDVNLFGAQRVNRAVLPSMRKRGSGLLVHVSSIVGRLVPPISSPYAVSKFALEALAESYHYELAPLGIESIIVEPGSYSTSFDADKQTPADKERIASYGPMGEMWDRTFRQIREAAGGPHLRNPEDVAVAIARLIDTPAGKRPLRTIVGAGMFGQYVEAINRVSSGLEQDWSSIQDR
ncbi:MAG TPA: SDR family oxidoreductase [Methanotrichaceae archaeon]|nr:SDR family oxidoreductase [Methanotrichaceae archaeon]